MSPSLTTNWTDLALALCSGRCSPCKDELVAVDGHAPERRCRGDYGWPMSGDSLEPRLVVEGRDFAFRMLWFLKDRAALGRLLLAGKGNESSSQPRTRTTIASFRLCKSWPDDPTGIRVTVPAGHTGMSGDYTTRLTYMADGSLDTRGATPAVGNGPPRRSP
jgi:hypothetical protein